MKASRLVLEPDSDEAVVPALDSSGEPIYTLEHLKFESRSPTKLIFSEDSKLIKITSYTVTNVTTLCSVTFPASLKKIKSYAFVNCSSLTTLKFGSPFHLNHVDGSSFINCPVSRIIIPQSARSIPFILLTMFDTLKDIELYDDGGKKRYIYQNYQLYQLYPLGIVYVSKYKKHVAIRRGTKVIYRGMVDFIKDKKIVIPACVEEIQSEALVSDKLARVTFSSRSILKKIGVNALGNTLITKLILPSTVECIHEGQLSNLKFLTTLRFFNDHPKYQVKSNGLVYANNPKGLVFSPRNRPEITVDEDSYCIYANACEHCSFTKLMLPSNVQEIGNYAFSNSKLGEIIITNDIKLHTIREGAFSQINLAYFHFPASIKVVEQDVFQFSEILTVEVSPSIESSKISNDVFSNANIKIMNDPGRKIFANRKKPKKFRTK